ncbi:MAG TPA: AbrB/MazE/SpoVT family DNA-binding domain-containing protein [Anaerolineaceae bacterium]|nr:AbrB/MazE/SpoVT family DNA-binding domain-containing protein [Anaerolineaceae bacterium]
MITTVRVQEKGQVTIPRDIRRQLKLKKGDLVTFISTENGVVIKTLDLASDDLLAVLATSLQKRGVKINEVLTRARNSSSDRVIQEFSLSVEESNILYQALQLKAQAAVESIRMIAETSPTYEITDEDIEAEIHEVRKQP